MKHSSLDTVGDSGTDPVPLCELVEGLHHSEMHTSELLEQIFSWSLISDFFLLIFQAAKACLSWCTTSWLTLITPALFF